MTSRLNITINAQDLLQKVLDLAAAGREALLRKEQAKQAQQEGDRQRETLREQQGFDPVTRPGSASGSTPSSSSSRASSSASRKFAERYRSRTPKFNDEPGIRRAPKGEFYVGVAWIEIIENPFDGTGVVRVGSGDGSKWAETPSVTYPFFDDVVPSVSTSQYQSAMEALEKPSWIGTIIQTPNIGSLQWTSLVENPTPTTSNGWWHATPKRVEFGSGSNHIGRFDVLPAGGDAAYLVYTDERSFSWNWSDGLYHGYRYYDSIEERALFSDGWLPIQQGSTSYFQRKVSVFYVTRTSCKLVNTPAWADQTYSTRVNGTYAAPAQSSGVYTGFRNPDDFYTARFWTSPMPETGESDIQYPPIGRWLNEQPPQWSYSYSDYQLNFPLETNPGFPYFPETDGDSFPGGDLIYLEPYSGGVFTPLQFFIGKNDYRGDATSAASRRAYKMVDYKYQADTENYSKLETDPEYLNGFSLPTNTGLTPQQVFDEAINSKFLAFKSSGAKVKKSRSAFATDGTAEINGDYASAVYFSDWERPSFCKSQLAQLGFSRAPLSQ